MAPNVEHRLFLRIESDIAYYVRIRIRPDLRAEAILVGSCYVKIQVVLLH